MARATWAPDRSTVFWRPITQKISTPMSTTAQKISSIRQAPAELASGSPPAIEFPGPRNLNASQRTPCRHDEPVNDASQVASVRKLDPSVVSVSQSAGGALSLKTLASIELTPG